MSTEEDTAVVRDLAARYAELAARPVQEQRRRLWSAHLALKRTRPTVLVTYGMHNVWCREVFGDGAMQCEDPFLRAWERYLRMSLFHHMIDDDFILEPWIPHRAAVAGSWNQAWGVEQSRTAPDVEGGAWRFDPPIKEWSDMDKLRATPHAIDEARTARDVQRLEEVFDGILPVNVDRSPLYSGFLADISTALARLRGLEQVMIDMYESPDDLHRLLAFMRDGILAAQQQAEDAGDWSLTSGQNQAMTYADELAPPCPNSAPCQRRELWGFCAAQEFTLVSPAFHDRFMFQYQLPIMRHFGLTHYGCCEDLTTKIDMLRQLDNLRIIAVAPRADVGKCAAQIGTDYVMSWRPNPTNMVCAGWNETAIRRIVREAMEASRGCHVTIHLKDVETVCGEPDRLARWVRIVRSISDDYA